MAAFAPIIIAGVFVAVFVCTVLFICHKNRAIKEQRRRRRQYQKQAEAQQQGLYTFPHFSPDELDAVQPLSKVLIHQSPRDQQQQQQRKNQGHGDDGLYILPSESNRSLHRLNSPNTNNQDDNRRAAANLLNGPSGQRAEQQQQQPQQSPSSQQQQRNRPVNVPRTSPDSHPSSPFLELSPLPAAYQQQGSSRRNPDRTNDSPVSPSFSPMQPQELAALPSSRANGNNGDDDVVRRAGSNYLVQPSPLPRPLHLRRPIVTDTSITPSSKVVATIGRGVPLVVQDDESNSPIEPPVVIIGKSPVLIAMGLNMMAHSPSSATTASPKATPPAKSTARKESIRRQATTITQTPTTQTQAPSEAQSQTQKQTQQQTPHQGVQFPTRIAEEQEFSEESENPFMSKEEFQRPAPQAILPEGFKHAQFTLPLPTMPSQAIKVEVDSGDDENDLDTGRLVLEPYLTPAELAAHVPFTTPAVPSKYAKDSAPSSPAAPVATDQSINQSAAPPRPPRRATDASDQQPSLSQSKIQEQRLQQRQINPPQGVHPLTPSTDAPSPLVHRSSSPSSTPSTLPSQGPQPSSSSSHAPSPSPSPTPSSLSNKSSSSTTRVKPAPPTLPPPRGSRSGSTSQPDSERATSPALSLSYTSSNISTSLSIISSQPETIVTDVSSFVSLGDTPTTTAYMICDSPGSPPVLSPTSPAFAGRSFSVSTVDSPATPRFAPGHSLPNIEGDDYDWTTEKNNNEDDKVTVQQIRKTRVPEAVGGGTRLSHFNFDV